MAGNQHVYGLQHISVSMASVLEHVKCDCLLEEANNLQ